MGNLISYSSTLNPFSFATGVIGLVSFLFTLATALRVFWQNLRTLSNADSEVRDLLPNLKQALYEERAILRTVRRRCRGQYDEAAFHGLYAGVRSMISQFKHLERPFLVGEGAYAPRNARRDRDGDRDRDRDRSGDSSWEKEGRGAAARRRNRTSNGRAENGDYEATDDYYMVEFSASTLRQRFKWLFRRTEFVDLGTRLSRVQTRRIARQTTDTYIETRYIARTINALQDRLDELEPGPRPRRGN